MSDLDNMLSGEEPNPEPQVEETPPVDQPESEANAPETPEVEEAPKPDAEPKAEEAPKPEMVPVSVVAELRREIRELKSTPKPEPQAPDVLDDPKGYANFMNQQASQIATNVRLDVSETMARQTHGDDVVQQAYEALQAANDQSAYQSLMQDKHPWDALVRWHKNQKVLQETGGNLDAWREQERQRIRQEVEAEMVTKQIKDNAAKPAPSLANATGTGGNQGTGWQGPADLDSLLG